MEFSKAKIFSTVTDLKKVFFLFVVLLCGTSAAEQESIKIRWVLAHEPARVFERAAQHFAKVVAKNSSNRLRVEILPASYLENKNNLSPDAAFQLLRSGGIEMSQIYTSSLGRHANELWVVELPFLFRDHEHAAKVLDGPIGQRLVAGLESSGVKGLGFTYSGGYRVLPSRGPAIHKLEDLKDKKIRVTSENPISSAYMKELGAIPVFSNFQEKDPSVVFETTYARLEDVQKYQARSVAETYHSLFLTTIIINKSFFDSLPDDMKKVIRDAAKEAAQMERIDSINDSTNNKKKFQADGIQILKMSDADVAAMKIKATQIYNKFDHLFSPQLVAEIQNTR